MWESGENEVLTSEQEAQAVWQIALTRLPGIGDKSTKKLIRVFGDAASIFRASKNKLVSAGLPERAVQPILTFDPGALKAELEWLRRNGIRLLFFTDRDYPQRLLLLPDAPPLLYYRGKADLNAQKILAVVGTRAASAYGRQMTTNLIRQLGPTGPLVISGLALGIDAAAHSAALANDLPTIGVLGHGLKSIYPPEHRSLAAAMVVKGGLLTSFPYHVTAERYQFPVRNKLVAGLCDALLVVETGLEGGGMLTVAEARRFGRKIFAVPGRSTDHQSAGCNALIRQGFATLISSGEELAAEMGWAWAAGHAGVQASLGFGQPAADGGAPETRLLQLIREKVTPDIDELVACSGLDASTVALTLLQLELSGSIGVLPGKRYQVIDGIV